MTHQIQDTVIFDGVRHRALSTPGLYTSLLSLEPRLKELDAWEMDAKGIHSEASTACWREYYCSWEIADARLYLVDVKGKYLIEGERPVFAFWYNGEIELPDGEIIEEHFDEEMDVTYEGKVILTFSCGNLIRTEKI